MDDKNLFKNIGVNVILKPITMILSFIYVPLIMGYLGEERYGIWATISSFVSWFSLCDIGIGNGMRNKLAESYALKEYKKSKEIVSTSYIVLGFISIIIFIIYTLIDDFADISSLLNISLENENVDIAILITVMFVCLNFVLSLASTIMYAVQKAAMASLCGVGGQIVSIIFVLCARYSIPASMTVVAILYGASTATANLLLNLYVRIKYKDIAPSIRSFKKREIKSITALGIGFFLGQVSSTIMNSTDNILISKFFGAAEVTPYSTEYKIFMILIQVQGLIIMPMWSAFTEANVRQDYKWIKDKMCLMNLLALLFSIGAVAIIFVLRPVTKIWLGRELNYDNATTIVMAIYIICYLFSSNYASLLCGLGEVKIYSMVAIIGCLINIPASIIFANSFGIVGIVLGTFVSMIPQLVAYIAKTRKIYRNWGAL